MNYALNISCIVEDKLALIQRPSDWTQADEAQAYDRCLKETLEENGRAWADGNIRVGDYILLSKSFFFLFAKSRTVSYFMCASRDFKALVSRPQSRMLTIY
jgi:hypothetical protein